MSISPVACDAVEDMGRLAVAEPGHIRRVAEIRRFPVLDTQEKHMLTQRWRKRVRQIEVRASGKVQVVVTHRVETMDGAATLPRLIAASVWAAAGLEK